MKAILISIQPKWCELIADGRKTIEVRKTRPKSETAVKCYIYCTKNKTIADEYWGNRNGHIYIDNGKVIGEFVCDRVRLCIPFGLKGHLLSQEVYREMCLTKEQLDKYGGLKTLYGWHISDLKIYDKPKELGEFGNYKTEWIQWYHSDDKVFYPLTRPPQSWCYVEQLE